MEMRHAAVNDRSRPDHSGLRGVAIRRDAMEQRRRQGEIRQRADEIHRQRIPATELYENLLQSAQQHLRAYGHIAHYSRDGFYGTFFEREADKLAFLDQTLSWPCYGDPTWTWSDVERAIQTRLRASKYGASREPASPIVEPP